MKKILLVEDDEATRDGIETFLTVKGYEIVSVENGRLAVDVFKETAVDLVILDIMLPGMNGFEVLQEIRAYKQTPVLMLTAMTDEATQITSFEEEADDYMSKPFSLMILEKRVEALLRRENSQQEVWTYKNARVNFAGFSATLNGEVVDVKPKEISLLKLLVAHPGQALSRQQILEQLWDIEDAPYDRVIDVYIKNLRKKLALDCIQTVKGIGYKYEEA